MRIVLHIGTHKTGTSSIQAVCDASRRALLDQGILYPEVDKYDRHSILAVPFLPNVPREFARRFGSDHKGASEHALALWDWTRHQVIANPQVHTILLSSEHFANALDAAALVARAQTLAPGAEIDILCYLRRPDDRYLSGMQQILKGSHKLLWPARANLLPDLDKWEGLGRLTLREFNRDTLVDGDAVSDVLDFIGARIPAEDRAQDKDSNVSLSAEGMAAMIAFRQVIYPTENGRFTPESMRLVKLLAQEAEALPDDMRPLKPRLRPEIRLAVLAAAEDRLTHLRDHHRFLFQDVSMYDFPKVRGALAATGFAPKGRPALRDLIDVDETRLAALHAAVLARLLKNKGETPSKAAPHGAEGTLK